MFYAVRPTPRQLEACLDQSARLQLSYAHVGIAQQSPSGFDVDQMSVSVAHGEEGFTRAKAALAAWKHFSLGWVEIFPPGASTDPGTVVVVVVRHLGFWSLNGCRVVYGLGDRETHFGFAYGSLTNHAETGEEIFEVSWQRPSADVVYRVRAVSKPQSALARLGYPFVRTLQARFRRDSAAAMRRALR